MRSWLALSTALLLGSGYSIVAAAGCENPPLVLIPAAETLSKKEQERKKEQEKAAEAMQKYSNAMQAYVACIQEELKAAGGDNAPELTKKVLVARNNAAVAEFEAVDKWYKASAGAGQVGPPAGPEHGAPEGKKRGK